MRTWFTLGLCCFLMASCSTPKNSLPQKDLIVGKWAMVDAPEVTEEFTKDGKSIRKTRTCKYTLGDDGTLEYKDEDGKTFAKYKAVVTVGGELTLTSGDGQVEKFKRVQ